MMKKPRKDKMISQKEFFDSIFSQIEPFRPTCMDLTDEECRIILGRIIKEKRDIHASAFHAIRTQCES